MQDDLKVVHWKVYLYILFDRWLHNEKLLAAAQKKYVYIYDNSGLEIHRMKQHTDVRKLDFLPYHFLLVTVVSTIAIVCQMITGFNVAPGRNRLP